MAPSVPLDAISLSPPDHRLPLTLMESPGGFMWWYADALNASGDGFVLIWSWGLPFLPGYASAQKRGAGQAAGERPSVNLSVYKGGKLEFYVLQEIAPEQAHWDGEGVWRFGGSLIEEQLVAGQRELLATLDLRVPGTQDRLQGTIKLLGAARIQSTGENASDDHDWSPLVGPAKASTDLRFGDVTWAFTGQGYHDRNGGHVPIHELPFDRWVWGRVTFEDRQMIYYLLWSDEVPVATLAIEIDADGRTTTHREVKYEQRQSKRGSVGLRWSKEISLFVEGNPWLEVEHTSVVDDGPFYMRFQIRGTSQGETAHGFAEVCVPSLIDRDLHRPLVKMRVSQAHRSHDSAWLPLFSGPRKGRIQRLLNHWLAR